ncbi:MAG: S9 family peptidase [Asticcacaulis sp.]|nr:S9 family peptidase [Asticcacaulis sp.]
MTISINRRTLFRLGGAAAAVNLAAVAARADETPAVATAPPPPVEAYAAPPFVDEIALSPDGSKVALISQKGDEKILTYMTVGQSVARPISLGQSKIRTMFFADNDHVVIGRSATDSVAGKREVFGATIVDLNTVKAVGLFEHIDGFDGLVYGNLARIRDGATYRVTASGVQHDGHGIPTVCLYSFDPTHAGAHLIHRGSFDTKSWVVTPDGFPLAYYEFSDDTKVWQLYFNLAQPGQPNRFNKIYEVRDALNAPNLMGIGRDGNSVVIFLNAGDEAGTYHEVSAAGVLGPALDPDAVGRDSTPLFHPKTGRLAGFAHHTDWFSYDYFDPLMKKLTEGLSAVMGDDIRAAITDFAEDPRKMIVYAESATDAGSYYFIDFSSGDTQTLASQYPGVPAERVSQKSAIMYQAGDGLEIHGYLTLPPFKSPKNLPLIVLPHGGPEARDYIDFDWQTQVLASRGYAVLQPNFRGSEGYGRDFVEKGYGQFGRKMQTDLSDGVRWLTAQGTVDSKRVAILGASYGGYAALAGATLDPGIYRCAVSIAGLSDVAAFIEFKAMNAQSNRTNSVLYWKRFMGDPATYDQISPAHQAEKASCPVLLLHGEDDVVVPIDQSKRMEKALKAAGKPVEFVTYKGQDHWETVGSARIEMMKQALTFLDKYNPAG